MQLLLFAASEHVRNAYDQLVLAYEDAQLDQIEMLKHQTMRTYVAIMDMQVASPIPDEPVEVDVLF